MIGYDTLILLHKYIKSSKIKRDKSQKKYNYMK